MLSISFSYFFFFAVFGLFLPYMSPVLAELGFPKYQIGILHAVFSLVTVSVPTIVGRISDRWLSADRIARAAGTLLLVSSVGLFFSAATAAWIFIACAILFAVARAPMPAMLDTLAMQVSESRPGTYGRMRVMGSIGFAITATLFGWLHGDHLASAFFPGLIAISLVLLILVWTLPGEHKIESETHGRGFWKQLDSTWWLWLLSMTLHWMCFGPYHYGFSLFLGERAIPEAWTGIYWSAGVAAEIAVFLCSSWFFTRWSYRTLLFVALSASLMRWSLLALFPTPTIIFATQLLHGPGFALFYAAALQAIQRYSGGVQRASYQSLFVTFLAGGGNVLGMGIAGVLHEAMPFNRVLVFFIPVQIAAIVVLAKTPLVREGHPSKEPKHV